MAIALVKAGAITTAAAATVTPAFGQATTAGNFLVARVTANGTTITTTSTGWSSAASTNGAAVFYKPNCGASETAPTFSCSGATSMSADLVEFSGVATTSPVDKTGTGTSVGTATSGADSTAGELAVFVAHIVNSKSATATITDSWTPSGGTEVAAQGTGATKSTLFQWGSAYITSTNSAADQCLWTFTPSTGTETTASDTCAIASFKVAAPTAPAAPTGVSAAVSGSNINVTWTDETTGNPTSKYAVLCSTDNTTFHQVIPGIAQGTQTYSDTGHLQYTNSGGAFSGAQPVGDISSRQQGAVSIDWPGGTLASLSLWLTKGGAPTDNLQFTIQSDSAGSPSGTVLATLPSVAGTSLSSSSWQKTTLTVGTSISAQTIWVVMVRSGALDGTNNYAFNFDSGAGNPDTVGGLIKAYNGTSWTALTPASATFDAAELFAGSGSTYYYKVKAYNSQGNATSTASTGVGAPVLASDSGAASESGVVSQSLTATDSGTATDTAVPAPAVAASDARTGAEGAYAIALSATDSGTAADVAGTPQNLTTPISASDSGTQGQGPYTIALTGTTDAGTAAEAQTLTPTTTATDSGLLDDDGTGGSSYVIALAATDARTGSDATAPTIAIPVTDAGSGAEATTLTATVTSTDSGTANDGTTTTAHTATDSGVLDDDGVGGSSLAIALAATDAGAGSDSATLSPAVTATDAGTASESIALVASPVASDSGSGAESVASLTITLNITDAAVVGESAQPYVLSLNKLPPDAIVTDTNLTGAVGNIQDDPDSPDGNWVTSTAGKTAATDIRTSFPTPPGGGVLLTGAGQQEFRILVRVS